MKNTEALIVVDYQNTFVPEQEGGTGELGVEGAGKLAPYINSVVDETRKKGGLIIETLDYHSLGHMSLASTYIGKKPITEAFAQGITPTPDDHPEYFITKDEVQKWNTSSNNISEGYTLDMFSLQAYLAGVEVQALWPDHAIAGEKSSELFSEYKSDPSTIKILKGERAERDSYSGFGGTFYSENITRSLDKVLETYGIKLVKIVGLATDYCIGATAEDALKNGYETEILTSGIAGVNPESSREMLEKLEKQGAKIIA